MAEFIYQRSGWPDFEWDAEWLAGRLAEVRHRQGRLVGRMAAMGFPLRSEALLTTLTEDVVRSSEIEGERLDIAQVRSSVARRLGLDIAGLVASDRHVDGVVEMTLDATREYAAPLTIDRLFGWHAALFPTGRSGMRPIRVGRWRDDRDGPMQVASGPMGRERIHFEAPAAALVDREMAAFVEWFEDGSALDPVLRAALAHLRFVTIHPFEDGNGRIARAITDLALARSEASSQRFYSVSAQIRRDRRGYYAILESTQRGGLDVTPWLAWFLDCVDRAVGHAEGTLSGVVAKAAFWESLGSDPVNDRQRRVLNRLLDGFEGKLTSSKWARLTNTSTDTALRDITDLVARGVLVRDAAGGRSTSYSLVMRAGLEEA